MKVGLGADLFLWKGWAVSLRSQALDALLVQEPAAKLAAVRAIGHGLPVGADEHLEEPPGVPGRPLGLQFVNPQHVPKRSVRTIPGRAALLHSLAHIEFNAINLALDVLWRYPGLPDAFYAGWLQVAVEEALHFELLNNHLQTLGISYGDLPVHDGLWDMAERTRFDLLARMALVPRTLEARGLDACPLVHRKLLEAGDEKAAAIIAIILRDEVGHVALGNYWYRKVCQEQGLSDFDAYGELAQRYRAPRLRGPFNRKARLQAGFTVEEIDELERLDAAFRNELRTR